MSTRLCLPLLLLFVFAYPVAALAQWRPDGVILSTNNDSHGGPVIASDGSGGAIMAWVESGLPQSKIYVQRVNASGVRQWSADGVVLCTAAGQEDEPTIVPDGSGGAIVAWRDFRADGDIYAQRVGASGALQWTTDGVALCTAGSIQEKPKIASDASGGAIVTWHDYRGGNEDIYAQRVGASGVVQWTTDGVAVCTAASTQDNPVITPNGAGGAFVAWQDYRNGLFDLPYVQQVNASGVPQWVLDGVPVVGAAGDGQFPTVVSDGVGGVIVAWQDFRNGVDNDIYAQRISASGQWEWGTSGLAVCIATNEQNDPTIASDGAGGAIVTWQDARGGGLYDAYAQRVDASGAARWTANGVALTSGGTGSVPTIASDGANGAIVTWDGVGVHIYAQRVSAAGLPLWTAGGVALFTATAINPMIIPDGAGGAIVTWSNHVQRLEGRYGYWGHPEPSLYSVTDVPADQGGKVKVDWYASGRDVLDQQVISHYSIWRATDAVAARAAVVAGAPMVGLGDIGSDFSGPAIREQKTPTADYFWELVGTQDAIYRTAYSFTASTNFDSTAAGPATTQFQIVAHAYGSQYINWPSNIVAGHSVDNVAPSAPLYLTAQRNGSEVDLTWNGVHVSDLKDYAVYRSDASGVTPIQTNFLANDTDTVLVDSGPPLTSLYYIVTAFDVHGNQSQPSNEVNVSAATNVGRTPSITALTVLQNRPNPFEAQTELEIGLPAASEVHLEVYDVAGHRVREEEVAGVKGWQAVRFEGRDDRGEPLASGMYFYKITARGESVTRKMLITR